MVCAPHLVVGIRMDVHEPTSRTLPSQQNLLISKQLPESVVGTGRHNNYSTNTHAHTNAVRKPQADDTVSVANSQASRELYPQKQGPQRLPCYTKARPFLSGVSRPQPQPAGTHCAVPSISASLVSTAPPCTASRLVTLPCLLAQNLDQIQIWGRSRLDPSPASLAATLTRVPRFPAATRTTVWAPPPQAG